MTTNATLRLTDVTDVLTAADVWPDDYRITSVPGAPHAVAVYVTNPTPARIAKARTALLDSGLLVDRDRELLVASLPQPARSPGLDSTD